MFLLCWYAMSPKRGGTSRRNSEERVQRLLECHLHVLERCHQIVPIACSDAGPSAWENADLPA